MLVRRVDSVPMPHFSSPALLLESNFWPASSLKLLLYGYAGDFTSNNQSEFAAAGVGLEEFIAAGGRRLDIFTGSEFLCNALPEWLAPDPNHDRQRSTSVQPLFVGLQRRIVECLTKLAYCRFHHVKAHAPPPSLAVPLKARCPSLATGHPRVGAFPVQSVASAS